MSGDREIEGSGHGDAAGARPRVAGIDAGATLTKLALPEGPGHHLIALPSEQPEAVIAALADHEVTHIGLTGGGAATLAKRFEGSVAAVDEFRAWQHGVGALLPDAAERFLLVSIGTGTSMMLVEGQEVRRIAGTPLGGGTILGLGGALAGTSEFSRLAQLAAGGDRASVDLSVADVYGEGDAPLMSDVMASSFARLAEGPHRREASPADLARSVMAMVGENVALLAGSLTLWLGVEAVVFGGSPLSDNPALRAALEDYMGRFGRKPTFLEDGAFAGALGARRLATLD